MDFTSVTSLVQHFADAGSLEEELQAWKGWLHFEARGVDRMLLSFGGGSFFWQIALVLATDQVFVGSEGDVAFGYACALADGGDVRSWLCSGN